MSRYSAPRSDWWPILGNRSGAIEFVRNVSGVVQKVSLKETRHQTGANAWGWEAHRNDLVQAGTAPTLDAAWECAMCAQEFMFEQETADLQVGG